MVKISRWITLLFVALALLVGGTVPPAASAAMVAAASDGVTAAPAPPVRLKIPRLGIDASVEQVGLTSDGAMDVPKNYDNVAWYAPGVRPGQQGNAVISGHVDSVSGPAVFWDLKELTAGDEVIVVGDDGTERRFVVRGWETYKATDAPLERIFGPTETIALNLITCDRNSAFDRSIGSYTGNVVVYTQMVA